MSIAQGTLHYDYPQVQLTDRPTFADFNPAFADIDAKLYSLITDSSTMDGRVDTLESSMTTAQNDISGLRTDVNLANAGVATNAEAITALQTTVGGHTATLKTKLDSVAIADAYDSEHGTYSVGDIVTYNGQRYKCITAVTAAEPFDADKWQGEDIQTVIDDINANLNETVLGTVTADGEKTWAQLMKTLYDDVIADEMLSIRNNPLHYYIKQVSGDEVVLYPMAETFPAALRCGTSTGIGGTGSFIVRGLQIGTNNNLHSSFTVSSSGVITVNDSTDTVVTSGYTMSLIKM